MTRLRSWISTSHPTTSEKVDSLVRGLRGRALPPGRVVASSACMDIALSTWIWWGVTKVLIYALLIAFAVGVVAMCVCFFCGSDERRR